MDRETSVRQLLSRHEHWDMAVIGGGRLASESPSMPPHAGTPFASSEQSDFGKGTKAAPPSWSTAGCVTFSKATCLSSWKR